jgi:myo-inositol-1(or 4)-monophosphatase
VKHEAAALLAAAESAARGAARLIRDQEGKFGPERWNRKARADFVTEVDREAERLIVELLIERFPGSRVVGEELTPGQVEAAPLQWIVDPLDGTTNFLHRFPHYAVSIAAVRDGVIEAGIVLDVVRDIAWTAARGGGAWADGEPIGVSTLADPAIALIGTGFPFKHADTELPRYLKMLQALAQQTAGLRRPGSAALDLCSVASGQFDGFFELALAPWDVAAGTLLVREAGGVVTDLAGADAGLAHGSIVAGNPEVHRWLLRTLREAEAL